MNQNPIQRAALDPLSGPPSSPAPGQVYYDTTLQQLLVWNSLAAQWQLTATNSLALGGQLPAYYLNRANATGTQLASTISNFVATAQAITLDTFAGPAAPLSINNQRLINVASPTGANDGVNKAYVDAMGQGLVQKPTARAATTGPLPANVYANGTSGAGATLTASANGALAVDGYAPALNDVILVKNEATAANNGLYTLTTLGTVGVPWVLTRSIDMNAATEFGGGFIAVENVGLANANSLWLCNVANSITVGTTAVTFTQLNGATDLTPGNGISISGNVVSFLPDPGANKGLVVTGSGAAIDQTFSPTWTGTHTFSALLKANLGLTVAGGVFQSRGITDSALQTTIIVGGAGNVTITPTIGYGLWVNGLPGSSALVLSNSGMQVGSGPTGGELGAGKINATGGYYVNGVALVNQTSANPSAAVGLAAVNGVASTFMTSDSAPPLNLAIAPTWTGAHTFSALLKANLGFIVAGASFVSRGITDNATATALSLSATGALTLAAPTTAGIAASITGSGGYSALQLLSSGMQIGTPSGNDKGAGTINVSGGYYVNGVALSSPSSANPSAQVGLVAVNGSAATFMSSDSAPALNLGISPTWTGAHIFSALLKANLGLTVAGGLTQVAGLSTLGTVTIGAPASGQALTVTGFAGSSALQLLSTGMQVGAPTGGELGVGKINASGGFYVNGVAVTANSPGKYATAFGDGVTLAYTITHNLGTQDVVTSVYSATTPFAEIDCDVSHATANTLTLGFATAPTVNQFRVVVHG